MSELDDLIRHALRDDAETPPPDETVTGRVLAHFLRRTRWVAGFAWMKMIGTLLISAVSAGCFFAAETTRAQIAWATLFMAGFVGFAMWWIWYWMILNRNDALRELKRLELQIAELRGREHS
jgi:Zn-dependent protease with chaperone function